MREERNASERDALRTRGEDAEGVNGVEVEVEAEGEEGGWVCVCVGVGERECGGWW